MTLKPQAGDRLTRRSVLGAAVLAASVLYLNRAQPFHAVAAAREDEPGRAPIADVEVAPGIFVHRGHHGVYAPANGGDICNTGYIVGSDAVAVIDTGGTALIGRALRDRIRSLTNRPIRYVINTHMHPDHVLGNAAFKQDEPAFIGHAKLKAALVARADRYLSYNSQAVGAAAFAGTEIVLPTEAIADRATIDLGGRRLLLEARPTAHTDNDLTIHDETTGTVFMGDLVFSGHVPTLDGSIRGWLKLLDATRESSFRRIVPGHGPASMDWPAAAAPIRRYLAAIADGVRQALRDGRTMPEAVAAVARSESGAWELFDEFHGRNVSAAFAELEWE